MVAKRRALGALLVALFVIILIPSGAYAAPIIDVKAIPGHVRNLLGHLADAHSVMKEWRTSMLEKAEWAAQKSQAILEKREALEHSARGELAGFGKGIPDWSEFANACEYDVEGFTVCNIDDRTNRYIENVVRLGRDSIHMSIFSTSSAIKEDVEDFIGRSSSDFIQRLSDAGDNPLNQLAPFHETQAHSAHNLDSLSLALDEFIETIQTEEQLDSLVSSGRANQLAAHISLTEAAADLELTRQRVQQLRVNTVDMLDRLYVLRRSESTVSRGLAW